MPILWNLIKISPVHSEIRWYMPVFSNLQRKCSHESRDVSVTGRKLTKLLHDVAWSIGAAAIAAMSIAILQSLSERQCAVFANFTLQVALLSQRDRATCLSVEILQLQNIAIAWHYLRDPTFSRFYTIPKCDRHTHTDGQTDTRRRHVLRLA